MYMTATDVLRRQKEQEEKLIKLYNDSPIGFMLAINSIINNQWDADKVKYKKLNEVKFKE